MEAKDEVGERTFRVNLSKDGAAKLAQRLTDVLKEYMGDFVDDTLVKYVIVLLGNGRRKEEVKGDLDVFLGDKSDSFVTWLWDHLASNLDHYMESTESREDEVVKPVKAKPELGEHAVKIDSQHPTSESEKGKANKSSRNRHNRDWKGLGEDDARPLIHRLVTHPIHNEEKAHGNAMHARQSVSPEPPGRRKRNRPDEQPRPKREVSQASVNAPRRLLQFAVREAVATARPSSSLLEPSRKRLRSVVSASIGNSTEEIRPWRKQSGAKFSNPMATAIKAVAEAAEDVRKVRIGNVFDRLSRGVDVQESTEQVSAFKKSLVQDDVDEDFDPIYENTRQKYFQKSDDNGRYHLNASVRDSSTGFASDSVSDNEEYDDVNVMRHRTIEVTETGTSRENKVGDSLMVEYSVAQSRDEMMRKSRKEVQEQPVSAANTKQKIVNISVNVSTWKPPHYQPAREMLEVKTEKSSQEADIVAGNRNVRPMKENGNPITVLGNGKPAADNQKQNHKPVTSSAPGQNSTGRPSEDADSRTIFVNNVHFAATKDTVSRHFNKFGDVLKVIILTDAATGHPKGSAYVEFMRKEAAEDALSLDGTSFMSRIIKVMKKSSAQPEANPNMTWPRMTRGSPFSVPRFAQSPFPRAFASAYRARAAVKQGARSMQWKRDAQPTSLESVSLVSGNTINTPPMAGRGLTYIRPEAKSDGNPGAT